MTRLGGWMLTAIVLALAGVTLLATFGGSQGQFPAAVIFLFLGAISLVGTLLFMGVALKLNDLSSHPFAFGLPNGSVRAFLAVLLVGLVGVFGTFVFFGIGNDRKFETVTFSAAAPVERAALQASLGQEFIILSIGEKTGPQGAQKQEVTVATLTAQTGKLDIAKQLVTIIATVLTTVIGFYFGSRSSEGRDQAGDLESIGRSAMAITAAYVGLNQDGREKAIENAVSEVKQAISASSALDAAAKAKAEAAAAKLQTDASGAIAAIRAAFAVHEKKPDDAAALAAERDKVAAATKKLAEIEKKLADAKAKPEILAA